MKIENITKGTIFSKKAEKADTSFSRMKGLLGRKAMSEEEALIITHCQSIHMFFMKFSIDAIFVNKKDVVVGLVQNIKPWQLSPMFFNASYVIELAPGAIEKTRTENGDKITITA